MFELGQSLVNQLVAVLLSVEIQNEGKVQITQEIEGGQDVVNGCKIITVNVVTQE